MNDSTHKHLAVRTIYGLLSAILLALFALSVCGETIPVNEGAGFDGEFYREVFRNFSADFFATGYDSFRIQRIFPFCLMNVVYNLAGIPLDNAHMMAGMYVLHFVNLALQLLLFFKLARLQGWKPATTVVLFSLFFFNYATLKNCGYIPFQTDAFAVTVALASYYAILKGREASGFALSLLGLVTWPTLTYVMTLLLLFPLRLGVSKSAGALPELFEKPVPKFFLVLPFVYGLAAGTLVILFHVMHKQEILDNLLMGNFGTGHIIFCLIAFSGCAWVIALLRKVPGIPYSAVDFARSFRPRVFIDIVLCIAAVSLLLRMHTNNDYFFDGKVFLLQVLIRPLKYPLVTLAGHVVYWGALPAFLVLFARDFVKVSTARSPGHTLVLLAFLFFALDSESRHIAPFLPLLLVPLGHALDKADPAPKFAIFTVILQLVLSHFYIPINVDGFSESLEAGKFLTPEAQRHFMNYGPWMTGSSYRDWIAVAIAALIGTNEVFKRSKRPQSGK